MCVCVCVSVRACVCVCVCVWCKHTEEERSVLSHWLCVETRDLSVVTWPL